LQVSCRPPSKEPLPLSTSRESLSLPPSTRSLTPSTQPVELPPLKHAPPSSKLPWQHWKYFLPHPKEPLALPCSVQPLLPSMQSLPPSTQPLMLPPPRLSLLPQR